MGGLVSRFQAKRLSALVFTSLLLFSGFSLSILWLIIYFFFHLLPYALADTIQEYIRRYMPELFQTNEETSDDEELTKRVQV